MGEQEVSIKPEDDLQSFPINADAPIQQRWLDNLDSLLAHKADCPYFLQTKELSRDLRQIVEELMQCEMIQITLDHVPFGYERFQESFIKKEEDMKKKRDAMIMCLLAKYASVESFAQKILTWEKNVKEIQKTAFPLKYKKNTFYYGMKSSPLKESLSFAPFCDYFYMNCPISGKMPLNEAVIKMKGIIPNTTEIKVRGWIKDFNRWARNPRNFQTQIGKKGKLLRVHDKCIVRLK